MDAVAAAVWAFDDGVDVCSKCLFYATTLDNKTPFLVGNDSQLNQDSVDAFSCDMNDVLYDQNEMNHTGEEGIAEVTKIYGADARNW